MTRSTLSAGPRWLLLCLLMLGVVGMHHFVLTSTHEAASAEVTMMAEMPMPDPMHHPEPAPSHSLTHLCMAVIMGAVLGLMLILLLLTVLRWDRVLFPPSSRPNGRVDRPPDLSGRALLTSVCVLRL